MAERLRGPAAVAALLVALALVLTAAGTASARTPAPSGPAFYDPPRSLLAGEPGTVVWSRPARGLSRIPGARTRTVLYRSRSLAGRPSGVSGTIAVPRGKPPRGGWPVVSWGHVTTGAADSCAPSRVSPANTELERLTRGDEIATRLTGLGIAVARSDYEGIGTPGPHPYLIGKSLGRSLIDIAEAARDLDPGIGRRWVAAGHSEGGQGALFAAALAARRAPELRLRGVSAFAPASHISDILELARLVDFVSPLTADYSALGGLILDGAAIAEPSLRQGYRDGGLSPQALALMPDVRRLCLADLAGPDSLGGLAPAAIEGPAADAVLPELFGLLDRNDPRVLDLDRMAVRLDQGASDLVVTEQQTREVAVALAASGAAVDLVVTPGATHEDITDLDVAAEPAAQWISARLSR